MALKIEIRSRAFLFNMSDGFPSLRIQTPHHGHDYHDSMILGDLFPAHDATLTSFFFLIKKIVLCIYFWLCWVYVAALAFSTGGEWGLLSSCSARASHRRGFSCRGAQALGSRASGAASVQAQQLLFSGLVAPRHVGSSLSRDQTRVSCTGKQILYW